MTKIDFTSLPHTKGRIDWQNSIFYNVPFEYDGIKGVFDIEDYDKDSQTVTIKYKNREYDVKTYNLLNCKLNFLFSEPISDELQKEWNNNKNGLMHPDMFSANSNKKVWWRCEKGHEWQARISNRTAGTGCPYCKGVRKNETSIDKDA